MNWEIAFATDLPLSKRLIIALILTTCGIGFTYFIYDQTGYYLPTLGVIVTIVAALFCGRNVALGVAITQRLTADYFFIPPFGWPNSKESFERFFLTIGLALLVSYFASLIRSALLNVTKAKQEAEQATIAMEQALALISHDVRNPLTAVSMGAQLILKTPHQNERHHSTLVRMIRNLERADSMIQSLLDVARIRAGKTLSLQFQNCDLRLEVSQIIEDMTLLGYSRLQFLPSETIWGAWSMSGIRRALDNLITNAIKYGDQDTQISIRVFRKGDDAVLSIHNVGKPISPEDQLKLFNPFNRTLGADTSNVRGWGLGLSLVKGVANAHGGVVGIESDLLQGTTFLMQLPIRVGEHSTIETGLKRDPPFNTTLDVNFPQNP